MALGAVVLEPTPVWIILVMAVDASGRRIAENFRVVAGVARSVGVGTK